MELSRRDFVISAASTLVAAKAFPFSMAFADPTIRVGLIGCGKRGTGAAINALKADPNVRITAFADLFKDQLDASLKNLTQEFPGRVATDRTFTGFNAFQEALKHVDLVILAAPPHFRPMHMEAAIQAGKHVFAEKPMAVDVPGIKRVLAATELARTKNLSIVSGLCYRYEHGKRETVARIRDGALGEIRSLYCAYNKNNWNYLDRQSGWSEMELQVRNFNHYLWLQGDPAVDLLVHNLDKISWAMGEYPVKAWGMGGKQVAKVGGTFDHHAMVFEYASGVRLNAYTRAMNGAEHEVSDIIVGTQGSASLMENKMTGWEFSGAWNDMYQTQFDEMISGIRRGQPINDGEFAAKSTFMGILGRWASYTGRVLTWDQVWNSKQVLGPEKYELGSAPNEVLAVPGKTKLV